MSLRSVTAAALALAFIGCGPARQLEAGGNASVPRTTDGAPAPADTSTPSLPRPLGVPHLPELDCGNVRSSVVQSEIGPAIDALKQALGAGRAEGHQYSGWDGMEWFTDFDHTVLPGATFKEALEARLAALPGTPIDVGALRLLETRGDAQSAMLFYGLTRVGAQPASFRRPVLYALLQRSGSGATILSLNLDVAQWKTTEDEAVRLAACTPPSNRDFIDLVPEWTFKSLQLIGCGPGETVTYRATRDDHLAWTGEASWVASAGPNGTLRWRLVRSGTYTISPENYWPHMTQADCYCGKDAGWRIEVDFVTGELLSAQAGISCVVC
ncbi:MAG: hypothetical protein K1X89_02220 [Myxococcaceae bacterium]|nr:hypothetical protein [Myxococcaceae bacterium]